MPARYGPEVSRIKGYEAPGRARMLVKKGDILYPHYVS